MILKRMKYRYSITALRNQKGALLLETFVGLMILAIGITGALRVFSQALYAGSANTVSADVREGLNRWLFEREAVPGALIVSDHIAPYYYRSEDDLRDYRFDVTLRPLIADREGGVSETKYENDSTPQGRVHSLRGGGVAGDSEQISNTKADVESTKTAKLTAFEKAVRETRLSGEPDNIKSAELKKVLASGIFPGAGELAHEYHVVTVEVKNMDNKTIDEFNTVLFTKRVMNG